MNLWMILDLGFYAWVTLVVLGWALRESVGALFWYFLFPLGLLLADFLGFGARASFAYHEPTAADFCVFGALGTLALEFFLRNLAPDLPQWWLAYLFRVGSVIPWTWFLFGYVAPRFLTYTEARNVFLFQCLWSLAGAVAVQLYWRGREKRENEARNAIVLFKKKPQGKAKS
ncbi:MAG TPA: hypothetical protein VMU88_02920 [bacterium]|nr:hypothetical protein [bacterium]